MLSSYTVAVRIEIIFKEAKVLCRSYTNLVEYGTIDKFEFFIR